MIKVIMKGWSDSYYAEGIYDNNGLTVKKGSKICLIDAYPKMSSVAKAKRHDRSVVRDDGLVIKDVTFTSPTAAAQFVTGKSINGNISWRPDNKMPLRKYLGKEQKKRTRTKNG